MEGGGGGGGGGSFDHPIIKINKANNFSTGMPSTKLLYFIILEIGFISKVYILSLTDFDALVFVVVVAYW